MSTLWNLLMRVGYNVLRAWIPILMDELGPFYAAVKPTAKQIVLDLSKRTDLSNTEKTALAGRMLAEAAKVQAQAQSESLINGAIQAAWREVKKELAAAATTKVPPQ